MTNTPKHSTEAGQPTKPGHPGATHSPDPGVPPGQSDAQRKGTPDSGRQQSETVPDKT